MKNNQLTKNLLICGDFNDEKGTDLEDLARLEKDLLDEMAEPIKLDNEQEIKIYNATLKHKDKGQYNEPWSEWHEVYGLSLFDYFFIAQGAYNEFKSIDHIYPEEFVNIRDASDHIPIVLKLKID